MRDAFQWWLDTGIDFNFVEVRGIDGIDIDIANSTPYRNLNPLIINRSTSLPYQR